MTALKPFRTIALLAAVLAMGACQREQPAADQAAADDAPVATEAPAEAVPETIPGTDVLSATPNTTAEAGVQPFQETVAGTEPREFAGTFTADGMTLNLAADGTYTLDAGNGLTDGNWSTEEDGARILLDPNSKSEDDRAYSVVSADELKAADGDQVLKRAN